MKESFIGLQLLDFSEIIAEYTLTKLLDKGFKQVKKIFETRFKDILNNARNELNENEFEKFVANYKLDIDEDIVLQHIARNIKQTEKWSREINFNLSINAKSLNELFIDLDLYLSPLKNRFDYDEKIETISSSSILNHLDKNIIVFGGPGAGKTTLVKNIYRNFFINKEHNDFSCPIIIRFRDENYPDSFDEDYMSFGLYEMLINILGIKINFPENKIFFNSYKDLIKLVITDFLSFSKVLLIFDGFDEIPNIKIKKQIEKDFRELSLSQIENKDDPELVKEGYRFILTSRNSEFKMIVPGTYYFEIAPLSKTQIELLIQKWLNNKNDAKNLLIEIEKSPYYDTAIRPLTLAHLCAIYERRKSIPTKPRYIYDLIIQLLLEAWDEQRGIIRTTFYADFYIEKKKEFLAHLAFYFSFKRKKTVFTNNDLEVCYDQIHAFHNLPEAQTKKVIEEIESHNGLIIQNSYNSYQFSHKSLQEFLTAKYLCALPIIPDWEILNELPNELAIAISLSSSPGLYFSTLLLNIKKFSGNFISTLFDRLALEKPDFTDDPTIIVFFLHTFSIWSSVELKSLEKNFNILLKTTNLKLSLHTFHKLYPKKEKDPRFISLFHVDFGTSRKSRSICPLILKIHRSVYDEIDLEL